MFFKSDDHRQTFAESLQAMGKVFRGRIDAEYGAALYILTMNEEMREKSHNHIREGGFFFAEMLEQEDFSSGYATLVKLARDLFTGSHYEDAPLHVIEFMNLDERNYAVAMTAIQIRRNSSPLADVEKE